MRALNAHRLLIAMRKKKEKLNLCEIKNSNILFYLF